MAKFDLTDLYKKQAELDAAIAANHNITYETTRPRFAWLIAPILKTSS